ncbi:hypothetical protein ACJQWK_06605 [Exserohilum turcicum]|uniref:Rhodopsin domain-containing protein n=1 Tax=Exserohilum turcicum (strain 28A) TaxID=671987 RepID=R0KB34_EXST2|nr:uncharacterized protein SETTUDRAFT_91916 [Exserohilum turcica Et28A]EOA85462.1 hypothetical protein SETTUDRAFT_91916 [Exserohilum turcica Et28A]
MHLRKHDEELEFLGSVTFYLIITLLALSYISVALRLWARYRITRSPGWDDAAMVTTLLLFTCYCSFLLAIRDRTESGRFFDADSIRITLIFVQLSEVFYILTTTFLKVSLGLFFLRVLTKRWQRLLFYAILTIGVVYGLLYFFVALFQCGNPAHIADNLYASTADQCLPEAIHLTAGYIYGIINILADWTFVLIPISVLVDSDLDRRSKISVSIVMGLGAVGSISAVLRMVYLRGLDMTTLSSLNEQSVKATIWATAEPGTGIIAASIAILRPLLRQVMSEVRGRASSMSLPRKLSLKTSGRPSDAISLKSHPSMMQEVSRMDRKRATHSVSRDEDEDAWSPMFMVSANTKRMTLVNGCMSPRTDGKMV